MAQFYYHRELKHSGLNKYRIVKAPNEYELNEKCNVILNQWNEMWAKKCEADQKRSQIELQSTAAINLTQQAEMAQSDLLAILKNNSNMDIDTSINPFLRNDVYMQPLPQSPIFYDIPVMPKRTDATYNPTIGFFSKLFGGEQRIIMENNSRFENAYAYWQKVATEIQDKNALGKQNYEFELSRWNEGKNEFEQLKENYNSEIYDFWNSLESADNESICRYFVNIIERLSIPIDYNNTFDFEYLSDSKIAVLDFCLPEMSELPNLKKVTYNKTQQTLKETYHTEPYMKKTYDQVIYQIVLSLLNIIFKADCNFNYLESLVINGRVNTIDRATGQEISPFILSVSVKKDSFASLNLENIDAKEWFKSNKGVSAATFSTVTPVMPLIQMSRDDSRFVEGYDVVNSIDNSTNLAAMDWQDFENLIRELFEKEFNQNGGEVKITQASRDGGVDAVAFDPDPIRGGKIVIQAKRYTNVVGVSAVRDLYGTVMNEGATKGILVSTANYGSDAYEFAKNKPLTLLNGANLLALLEKHGHKAKIDMKEAKEYFAETGYANSL